MPHPFDGTTDFRSWLRRYEAAADAAQWSERSRASRLGMYLEEDFFDSWEELASKTNWKDDKVLMLSLFAKRSPDEALRAFNSLAWDGHQRFVVFAARLGRYLKEYNRSLPEGQRMSAESMGRQIFDRCVAVAPEGAQQELRKQQDYSIRAICSIVDDYSPGTATKDGRMISRPPVKAESQPLAAEISKALQSVLAPMMENLAGITQRLDSQQRFGKGNGGKGRGRGGCGNCGGAHSALACPNKAFDSGCFKCGQPGHLAPERSPLREPPAGSVIAGRPEAINSSLTSASTYIDLFGRHSPQVWVMVSSPLSVDRSALLCGVIDTGSDLSLIPQQALSPSMLSLVRPCPLNFIRTANGGTCKILGVLDLDVCFYVLPPGREPSSRSGPTKDEVVPGPVFPVCMIVIDSLSVDMLLGMDFLRHFGMGLMAGMDTVRLSVPQEFRKRMSEPNIPDWLVNSADPVVMIPSIFVGEGPEDVGSLRPEHGSVLDVVAPILMPVVIGCFHSKFRYPRWFRRRFKLKTGGVRQRLKDL
ncbi:hypothetical protein FOL46_002192 [Perkinsus olseni]|uniref:Peptidase A2 domain-containing protein n=1 Tax=Perkinsus olseni TaxID=32597 RepID=A0A7J6KR26_PEROL|nr:hypothetical protein FOL46_002192 [Perkinsus olseni]